MATARAQARLVSFFAPGSPASQGSKRGFVVKGRVVLADDDKGLKSWRSVVATAAREAGASPIEGPVGLHLSFRYPRPRSHYGTGKNAEMLRASAPAYPATRSSKDADKLARGVCDALTAICFQDDSQVAHLVVKKRWAAPGSCGGVYVWVYPLPSGLALREGAEEA